VCNLSPLLAKLPAFPLSPTAQVNIISVPDALACCGLCTLPPSGLNRRPGTVDHFVLVAVSAFSLYLQTDHCLVVTVSVTSCLLYLCIYCFSVISWKPIIGLQLQMSSTAVRLPHHLLRSSFQTHWPYWRPPFDVLRQVRVL